MTESVQDAVEVGQAIWRRQWRLRPFLFMFVVAAIAFSVYAPAVIAGSSDAVVAMKRIVASGVAPVAIASGLVASTTIGRFFDLSRWTHVLVARPRRGSVLAGFVTALAAWTTIVASLPLGVMAVFVASTAPDGVGAGGVIALLAAIIVGLLQVMTVGLLGGAAAFVLRSAAAAGIGVIAWFVVLEPIVSRLTPTLAQTWLPGPAVFSLGQVEASGSRILVVAVWLFSASMAAWLRFGRMDVT